MLVYCGQCKIIDFSKFETVSNWKTVQNGVKKGSCTFVLYVCMWGRSKVHSTMWAGLINFALWQLTRSFFSYSHYVWISSLKSLIWYLGEWSEIDSKTSKKFGNESPLKEIFSGILQNFCDKETKSLRNFSVLLMSHYLLETSQLYLFLCDCVDFLSLLFFQFSLQYFWNICLISIDLTSVQGTQMRETQLQKNKAGKCK